MTATTAEAPPAKAKRPRKQLTDQEKAYQALPARARWARRVPLMPAFIFTVIITQLPFVATIIISFLSWNRFYPNDVHFAGFDNFVQVFSSSALRSAVVTTVLLTVIVVVVSLVLGFVVALLLDRKFLGRGIVRTLMIAPFLIVPIAAALVWKHALLNPEYGLFNGTLRAIWGLFGDAQAAPQPDWISNAPLISVAVTLVWQWTPFMMLILLAGLQGRPLDVIEAARVDGASAWQVFRYMTLPYMRQYLELAATLGAIYIVQNFDAVFTVTAGGLGTANLPYVIYQRFFVGGDYGVASAAGVVTVIASLIIATFALRSVSSLLKDDKV